jgi:hypothetical protein
MLDLRKTKIKREELVEFRQFKYQQIRDLLLELEQADALMNDKSLLLTREETAEKLRCEPDKIPKQIPRVRIGAKRCFQLGDIEHFIATHKK